MSKPKMGKSPTRKSQKNSGLRADESRLLADYERGDLRPVADLVAKRDALIAAAEAARKDQRLNIRLSQPVLAELRRRAAEEGLPYQTLIASVLHKYATGRLIER
ncbi:MAG: hypothetical protein RL026_2861 [Pseudomonadota bacterium]|jgi:predicted DNA binding CopG/RHH family protein